MWALVVTNGPKEFLVRDRLCLEGLEVFCPYERVKQRVKVRTPRTTSNPRPRTTFQVIVRDVARWPRYLFARAAEDKALSTILTTRDVSYVVRGAEGEAAKLPDIVIDSLRKHCDTDGRVLKRSELLGLSVGALLRFVDTSAFAGHAAKVTDLHSIDETGFVKVLVDGRYQAVVHFSQLSAA